MARLLLMGLVFALILISSGLAFPVRGFSDPMGSSPGPGGMALPFPFSSDEDISKGFQALAPPFLPWGPNTSGPFFTGTAEVEPIGSWYLETFVYDAISPGSSSYYMPMRLAVGLGHNLELDTFIPLIDNVKEPPITPQDRVQTILAWKYTL